MLFMKRAYLIGLLFTVILAILFLYTLFETGFGARQLNYKKGKDCRSSHNLAGACVDYGRKVSLYMEYKRRLEDQPAVS